MKWRILIVGSLALEHVKEISDEFVQYLTQKGAKISQAEVIVSEKMEESINLLHERDLAAAAAFTSRKDGGTGYANEVPVLSPPALEPAPQPETTPDAPTDTQPENGSVPSSEPAPQPAAEPVTAAAASPDAPQAS